MQSFYPLPVGFKHLMQHRELPTVTIHESIRQHVFLILMTSRGEWRYDYDYNGSLWEKDFEQTDNMNMWLDDIKNEMMSALRTFEKRLEYPTMAIQKDELEEINKEGKVVKIRNRLTIYVQGTIIQTNESFEENYTMFFGPITIL